MSNNRTKKTTHERVLQLTAQLPDACLDIRSLACCVQPSMQPRLPYFPPLAAFSASSIIAFDLIVCQSIGSFWGGTFAFVAIFDSVAFSAGRALKHSILLSVLDSPISRMVLGRNEKILISSHSSAGRLGLGHLFSMLPLLCSHQHTNAAMETRDLDVDSVVHNNQGSKVETAFWVDGAGPQQGHPVASGRKA
jgi:hypothetical protein